MGNEHEHIAKTCEWLMVRTDVDETKGDMVRVFDAERTDNCCRRLSASRYAHLFFLFRCFFLQISRCFKGLSHRSLCLFGVYVTLAQRSSHFHSFRRQP